MMAFELTDQDRHSLIDAAARRVVSLRLEAPAIFLLELHKPLAFIAGQSLLVASPLLAPLFGVDRVHQACVLLSERENVECLIQRIEELAEEDETQSQHPDITTQRRDKP